MWKAIQRRLDAKWRRVLFIPWLLLVLGGTLFAGLTIPHLYEAGPLVEVPENCSIVLDRWKGMVVNPERAISEQPSGADILSCAAYAERQVSWLNVKLLGLEAGRFFFWAALLGFFIFTHGWARSLRSFWEWLNLRTP